jgi:5-methylcytosine-specific restriction protein A
MRLTTLKPSIAVHRTQLSTLAHRPGATDRLRGRAAVDRRERYLRMHPLCTKCESLGRVEAATVPDHIIPLWAGGRDDLETNGQPLCPEHHDAKTACEARMRAAGGWLSTACICGQHDN